MSSRMIEKEDERSSTDVIRLPDRLDLMLGDQGVGGEDGQTLEVGLRDEHPIEGIAVQGGQGRDV